MGYDQYTVPDTVAVELAFLYISNRKNKYMASRAILANFFEQKNGELKTNHNTFRDCRMCFFRQPFCKGNP